MNLVIDIGNSFFHMAVFKRNKPEYFFSGISSNLKSFNSGFKIISKKYQIRKIGYSSVVPKLDNKLTESIIKYFKIKPLTINYKSKLPVNIKVKNAHTLGSDRICNSVFGYMKNSNKVNTLVIDLGTANKYDLVLKNGNYIGGIIAPGLITSSIALNLNTGKLPVLKINDFSAKTPLIGRNTSEAIQSGLINYMIFATEGIVYDIKKKYPGQLKIYLSGGSAKLIKNKLAFKFVYVENSVLTGLNYILNYQ